MAVWCLFSCSLGLAPSHRVIKPSRREVTTPTERHVEGLNDGAVLSRVQGCQIIVVLKLFFV